MQSAKVANIYVAWLKSLALIAALSATWQPSKASAQDNDTQFWLYLNASGEIADDTRITVDISQRWREQARGDEQQTLRFSIDHSIAEGVTLGGGAGIFENGGTTEIRPHQQLTLASGRFAARSRIEQRFFDGAEQMELRFRQRVQYTQPLAQDFALVVNGEWLRIVQARQSSDAANNNQWRALALINYRLNKDVSISAGYLVILSPLDAEADLLTHVPQVVIGYRF
jgi:hypothetical protein